ncbi:MAG: proline--tRNA ligase [Thermoprotei archaeon]|nr:MAG: proline--tRNA ligase [Thermoprotei archaeon]HDI32058.1 proline--tRNA ligase [Thermofilum sp.]
MSKAIEEKALGITVSKSKNFSEWFTQVITKADLVDQRYNVQGFIVHKPWAMRIIREIYRMFEEELENTGHEPVLFPLVIPEENFEREKEHVEGFKPEVFWITEAGDEKLEKRLALRPTSETAFYSMYPYWIKSWRDLPLKLYQSVSVYRYEKNTRPFIRGREFLWIEAHNAFTTHEEALRQVKEDMENSRKVIWEKLGIPFLFLRRPQWDKFAGARDTYAADTLLPDGRVLQISSTHDLGQGFAKAFDIKFLDKDGKWKYVWQTCYGPGIWRIVAALIGIHGDDKGLILPFDVAPIQVVIIPIYYSEKDKEEIMRKCGEIKEKLKRKGIRVYLDDREEKTPGWKFNDWELKGVPFRIEIGSREVKEKVVTIFRRDILKRVKVAEDRLIEELSSMARDMLNNLKEKALNFLNNNIYEARNKDEVIKGISGRKIVKMAFCGKESCAEEMRLATGGAKVRGTPLENFNPIEEKCAWCGEKARYTVYVAKAY